MSINRQWLVNGNPRGRALEMTDFEMNEAPLDPLAIGEVRVKTEYLSFEPSQKGQMEVISGYSAGATIGDVMGARGIGEVVESLDDSLPTGSKVIGSLGWQEYATLSGKSVQQIPDDNLATARLGPLGAQGLTAYFGLLKIGQPEAGDTVVVSGAAGAVGSVVGQIAKINGCKTVGTAGSAEKCEWLTQDLGFDAAIDYKNDDVKSQLKAHCASGVNVFFDNVGGPVLNNVLARIASGARVVICGGISRYEQGTLPDGPANYFNVVFRQAKIEGFLLSGYEREYDVALGRITGWIESGELKYREDVQEGFENIPATLKRLFTGKNIGKQLLKF
ncbi:MAG: NADPH-dependent curcumin reductase CurA [Candidatus Azotimanducaceae bacterium]|jgi:NADPH-dependent curcumin reductase CurA